MSSEKQGEFQIQVILTRYCVQALFHHWLGWRALYCPTLIMILLVWNCRGIGQSTIIHWIIEDIRSHRADVIFLFEIKTHKYSYVSTIVDTLGFSKFHFVPAMGNSWGLMLHWKETISIQIIAESNCIINCLMLDSKTHADWQCSSVYGPPVASLKDDFWNMLNDMDLAFLGP